MSLSLSSYVCTYIQGGVLLDKYKSGADLRSVGVVPGGDMTTEACVTKLIYLFGRLGRNRTGEIKEWMEKDLRGEVSPVEKYHRKIYSRIGFSSSALTGIV